MSMMMTKYDTKRAEWRKKLLQGGNRVIFYKRLYKHCRSEILITFHFANLTNFSKNKQLASYHSILRPLCEKP